MSNLLIAVYLAFLIAPFLALIALIPYMLHKYKKEKYINIRGTTDFYIMVILLLMAYFLTMLPFPSRETVEALTGAYANLYPFTNIHGYLTKSGINFHDISSLFPSLTHWTFLEPAFNVCLILPLGFFLRDLFDLELWKTALIGFFTSLFFEVTQLTGLFFIYPRPYRLFDVDDLITNTTGVIIGWLLYGLIVKLFPSFDDYKNEPLRQGGGVSMRRRLPALIVDQGIVILCVLLISVPLRLYRWRGIPWMFLIDLFLNALLGLGIFFFGNTPGNAMMGLQPRDLDTSGNLAPYEKRAVELRRKLHKEGWKPSPLRPWQGVLRQWFLGSHLALPVLIAFCIHETAMVTGILYRVCFSAASALLTVAYIQGIFEYLLAAVSHAQTTRFDRICDMYLSLSTDEEKTYRFSRGPRQKILAKTKLSEKTCMQLPGREYEFLLSMGINQKTARRVEKMSQSILNDWLAMGMEDHICILKYDSRPWKNTLVLVLLCKNPVEGAIDSDGNHIDQASGLCLAYARYYAYGAYIYAIDVPSLEV